MKNVTSFVFVYAALIVLTACQKIVDKWPHGKPSKNYCRIAEITQSQLPVGGDTRTGKFYYNPIGRLDSIIFDLRGGTGTPQLHYFFYDKHNRLTAYRSDYTRAPGAYYWMHKYVWQGNKIVRDSIWLRGAGLDTIVIDLEYDKYGRISAENRKQIYPAQNLPDGPTERTVYDYDENGNRLTPFPYAYDDKPSYMGTNIVLQFIHRDFSKNNPFGATGYNAQGLPLGFGRTYSGYGGFLDWGHPETITYDCR